MGNLFVFCIYMFIGYLVGAFFSDHIFIDLGLTHWTNLWVYFWMLLWPLGLAWHFFLFIVCVFIVVALGAGIHHVLRDGNRA